MGRERVGEDDDWTWEDGLVDWRLGLISTETCTMDTEADTSGVCSLKLWTGELLDVALTPTATGTGSLVGSGDMDDAFISSSLTDATDAADAAELDEAEGGACGCDFECDTP